MLPVTMFGNKENVIMKIAIKREQNDACSGYAEREQFRTKFKGLRIGTMKYLSLAALLIASATFVACSGSDNDIIIDETQPVNPTGQYTMTIKASKGDDAATRALTEEIDGETGKLTLNATWDDGEKVLVYQGDTQIGTLTSIASTNNETTLSGTLDSAPDASQALTFYFHTKDAPNYTSGQDGTLATIASLYDFCLPATVAAGGFTVENNTVTVPAGISFGANQQAIAKFTFVDKADATKRLNANSLSLSFGFDATTTAAMEAWAASSDENAAAYENLLAQLPTYSLTTNANTYPTNGDGVLYLAIPDASAKLTTLNGLTRLVRKGVRTTSARC